MDVENSAQENKFGSRRIFIVEILIYRKLMIVPGKCNVIANSSRLEGKKTNQT